MRGGDDVKPLFLQAVFVMAWLIFDSPAQRSATGPTHDPANASLKAQEAHPLSRLRFTKPRPISASRERTECLNGGEDDERTSLSDQRVDAQFWVCSMVLPTVRRPLTRATTSLLVRLRC
jgi:hypothetical protein